METGGCNTGETHYKCREIVLERDNLRAEVERLREALKTIEDIPKNSLNPWMNDWFDEAEEIAKQALKGGSDTTTVSCDTASVAEGE